MTLVELESSFAVCRLDLSASIPSWATQSSFFSITKTKEELSIVCEESLVPAIVKAEKGWRMFKVQGPLDFALTGVVASISKPLAEAKISLFVISSFDTDFILVKNPDFSRAQQVLIQSGFNFVKT